MTFAESSVTSLSLDGEITARNVSTIYFGGHQAQFSDITSYIEWYEQKADSRSYDLKESG